MSSKMDNPTKGLLKLANKVGAGIGMPMVMYMRASGGMTSRRVRARCGIPIRIGMKGSG